MAKNDKKPVAKKPQKKGASAPTSGSKAAVKSSSKSPLKSSSEKSDKSAKGSKPLVKSIVKVAQKILGKATAKAPSKPEVKSSGKESTKSSKSLTADKSKTAKSTSVVPEVVKAVAAKKDSKKTKKAKKSKDDEIDMGDDLVGDDDMGAEDIPDLAEFEDLDADDVEDLDLEDDASEAPVKASSGDEEVVLTDAEGRRYCRVRDCDQISVVEGYCRFHYLQLWKKIQIRRKILTDGKLQRYVEELTARYPDKFLEMIRKDLRAEKDFHAAIAELEIDESAIDNEFEDEAQNFIDEVRGMSETSGISDDQEEF